MNEKSPLKTGVSSSTQANEAAQATTTNIYVNDLSNSNGVNLTDCSEEETSSNLESDSDNCGDGKKQSQTLQKHFLVE